MEGLNKVAEVPPDTEIFEDPLLPSSLIILAIDVKDRRLFNRPSQMNFFQDYFCKITKSEVQTNFFGQSVVISIISQELHVAVERLLTALSSAAPSSVIRRLAPSSTYNLFRLFEDFTGLSVREDDLGRRSWKALQKGHWRFLCGIGVGKVVMNSLPDLKISIDAPFRGWYWSPKSLGSTLQVNCSPKEWFLSFFWELPEPLERKKFGGSEYYMHVLRHNKGGMYSFLKENEFCKHFTVRIFENLGETVIFGANITLTEKGSEQVREIAATFLDYVDLVTSAPIEERFLKELQNLWKVYDYPPETVEDKGFSFSRAFALRRPKHLWERGNEGDHVIDTFDPQAIYFIGSLLRRSTASIIYRCNFRNDIEYQVKEWDFDRNGFSGVSLSFPTEEPTPWQ